MTDVLIEQSDDGGEVTIESGLVTLTDDFRSAAYLSLFGGNEDDNGLDSSAQWWGNLGETEPNRRYRSRTEYLLQSLAPSSANLLLLEDAARADLQWLIDTGAAKAVDAVASIPALNKLSLVVIINGDQTVTYLENWAAFQ
jgi:phage gp46-like protein